MQKPLDVVSPGRLAANSRELVPTLVYQLPQVAVGIRKHVLGGRVAERFRVVPHLDREKNERDDDADRADEFTEIGEILETHVPVITGSPS